MIQIFIMKLALHGKNQFSQSLNFSFTLWFAFPVQNSLKSGWIIVIWIFQIYLYMNIYSWTDAVDINYKQP